MFEVKCPECDHVRKVSAKKPWMKGQQPFIKICKSCCQVGKEKSEEHKAKLSESAKNAQTPEILSQKSEFQKAHPEIWQNNLIAGKGAGWNKGLQLPARSEETKQKISETLKDTKKNKGQK